MPHIHTGLGQHDFTASAFIVVRGNGEQKLLLHKHKILGIYLQFGGHIELDETPWEAVAHEIEEEAGYDLNQLKLLQPKGVLSELSGVVLHPQPFYQLTHAFNDDHFHTDTGYLFVTDELPKLRVQSDESQEIRTFSKDELVATTESDTPQNIRELGAFIFDTCLGEWVEVIVNHFSRRKGA